MMNDDDINNNGRGKYSYGYGYDEDGGGGADDDRGGEYYDGFENDDSAAYAYADPGAAAVANDAAVVKVLSSPTRRRSNRRRVNGSSPVARSRKQQSSPSLSPSLTNRKKHKQKMLGSSLLQHQFSTSSKDSGSGEISQNSQRSIDFAPSVPLRSTSVSPPASPVKVQQKDIHHHHHHRDGTVIPAAPSSKDAKQQQGFWNVLAQARKKWEIQNNNNNNTSDSRYHKQKKKHNQSLDTTTTADVSSHLLYLEGSSSHINFSYGGDDDDDGGGGDFEYHRRHNDGKFEDEEGGGSGPVSETLLPTNSAVIMDDGIRRHQHHEELHQRSSVHHHHYHNDPYGRSSKPALYDDSTPAGPAVGSSSYNDDSNAAVDTDLRWGDGSYSAMMMDMNIPGATTTVTTTGGGDNRSHLTRPPKKPLQYDKERRKKKKVMSAFSCMPTNTLLIGGQYYPGKDKKRSRHYMNTGLTHTLLRAFCGTPTRQTFSVIVTAYILVYWLIVPIGEYVIFGRTGTARNVLMDKRFNMMGRPHRRPFGGDSGSTEGGWSNGGLGGGGRLFFDSGEGVLERLTFDSSVFVNLPPLQEELKYSHALYEARRSLLQPLTKTGGSGGTENTNPIRDERLRLLESIVPEWYHRFDEVPTVEADTEKDGSPNAGTDSTSKLKEVLRSNITKTTTQESKNAKQHQPQHLHHKKHRSKRNSDDPGDAIDKKELIDPSPSKSSANTTKHGVPKTSIGAVTSRTLQEIGGLPTNGESGGDDLRLPLRTIHNMDEIGTKYSLCGRQQSSVDTKVGNATNGVNGLRSLSQLAGRSTTLVVQTSTNRLWILNETCTRWSHDPIVATVFIPYEEHRHSQQQAGDDKEPAEDSQEQRRSLLNLADTLDCPNLKLVEYLASEDESQLGHYPVNRLRNVGLDQVTTDHVLVVDVDFVPSQDLDLLIRKSITYQEEQEQAQKNGKTSMKTALVVPAFEKNAPNCSTDEECASYLKGDSSFLPHTFDDLVKCYQTESEDCTIFQSTNNWEGHSTTRSEMWLRKEWYEKDPAGNQTEDENNTKRLFREITCFDTARYEPYLVLEWCPLTSLSLTNEEQEQEQRGHLPVSPYYDERFYGYGKNKIELVSHVRYRGYRLRVLPEGFIIHNPHLESMTKQTWNDRHQDLHSDMDSLYSNFLRELRTMYSGNLHTKDSPIQLCKRPNH
eukprot:CAMPEP_0113450912 /NCGR_PEP_ID=MMETSP0014_2-20120614/6071_1 /TAXON_ID=2857 /ORGANISM="Nitzschia sp." /LENGTH=1187 /DNA_ID=CAMNT_0000342259 /DNA_START=28 /DNA_END=3591 /DNA_ORIENTATION=+ /assembly_acc=CAM_ASM_000159